MNWLLLTLLGVLFFSPSDLLHRAVMKDEQSDPYAQSVVFFAIGGTVALVFALLHHGGFQYRIGGQQLLWFLPLAACTTIGPVLLFTAFQRLDASEIAVIFQASIKLWTVFGAFLFLGETFAVRKVFGTLFVIMGITIALWNHGRFRLNRGVVFVLAATVFYASADLISFFLVRAIDPISLIVYVCYLPVVTLLVLRPKTVRSITFYFRPRYAACVSVLGFNDTLGTLCFFYAYRVGRNVAQISPIAGTITILKVGLAIVFLREYTHLPSKLLGAAVTVIGALLVL